MTQAGEDSYTADKTYAEIREAVFSRPVIVMMRDGDFQYFYQLYSVFDGTESIPDKFVSFTNTYATISFNDDNSVEFNTND